MSNYDRNSRIVSGLFNDRDSAENAYQMLTARGYSKDDVTLVMSDDTRKRLFSGNDSISTELGNKAAEGAGIGAGVGGMIGAVASLPWVLRWSCQASAWWWLVLSPRRSLAPVPAAYRAA